MPSKKQLRFSARLQITFQRWIGKRVRRHICAYWISMTITPSQSAVGPNSSAAEMVSAAQAWIGRHGTELIQDCIQLHGGIGVTWDHDLHLYLRRATVNRLTYGTPEEHAEGIAARALGDTT